jgi:ElaB/YqjD/DUF883 family membrane-anchored ribosome-binding protein
MEHTDRLREDFKLILSDAEELLRATAEQGGERAAAARERVEASLRAARDRLEQAGDAAAKHARQAAHDTDRYVHMNPWTSIGVAAGIATGVGLLIGYIMGRR